MIAILGMKGVPLEISLPATAIIRITTLWFAIGIGLAVFPFAERISLKRLDLMSKRNSDENKITTRMQKNALENR